MDGLKACLQEVRGFGAEQFPLAVAGGLPQLSGAPRAEFVVEISGEGCLLRMAPICAWHLLAVARSGL